MKTVQRLIYPHTKTVESNLVFCGDVLSLTGWTPKGGYDPHLKQYKCWGCGFSIYKIDQRLLQVVEGELIPMP